MKKAFYVLIILLAVFFCEESPAKTLRVAVIDTGFTGIELATNVKFCDKSLHRNFSIDKTMNDVFGHGNMITEIIGNQDSSTDYCIVVIKYYERQASNETNLKSLIKSIQYATFIKSDIINISSAGNTPDSTENLEIIKAVKLGIVIVAAAGNQSQDLDKSCDFFPCCYKGVTCVAAVNERNELTKATNFGKITVRARGEVGSSQAAANYTRQLIQKLTKGN